MSAAVGKRVVGRPFVKGQSGNPEGSRKHEKHITSLAKAHTAEAIHALVLALKSPRERVPAAVALLDRGWGKPVQMVSSDPDRPIAIAFQWSDGGSVSGDNVHTDAQSPRQLGEAIEGAIVDVITDASTDDDAQSEC